MDQRRRQLLDRQMTWFARYLAALSTGNYDDAEDCKRQLATLGIWVDAASRIFTGIEVPE